MGGHVVRLVAMRGARLGRILGGLLLGVLAGLGGAGEAAVFCHYNLENYGVEGREGGEGRRGSSERWAVLDRVICEIQPDILGVCEVGSREALEGLRRRLGERGLSLPETEYVEGPDPDRHLALLSRYPIVGRNSQADVVFWMDGRRERVRRGFLDVELDLGGYRLRAVGVHLKSKLAVEEGEAGLRRWEARMLRRHVEEVLRADPEANVICYGDFNENRNEPGMQELLGAGWGVDVDGRRRPGLRDLRLEDSCGERWTHWWRPGDVYARLDYLLVSPGLWPEVDRKGGGIYRSADWHRASDHRAVYVRLMGREVR